MLAKSKLSSNETLILQAVIDMEISHEEFITILSEKDKYEKMKDNLRSENEKHKIIRLSSINQRIKWKSFEFFCRQKKLFGKGKYFWVNRKDLEVESDVANWAQIFDKCDPKKTKQKYRHELMPNTKFQQ